MPKEPSIKSLQTSNKKLEAKVVELEQKLAEANSVPPQDEGAAVEACRKIVTLIDPKGVGHIPSGDPGEYQEVLVLAGSVVEGADKATG